MVSYKGPDREYVKRAMRVARRATFPPRALVLETANCIGVHERARWPMASIKHDIELRFATWPSLAKNVAIHLGRNRFIEAGIDLKILSSLKNALDVMRSGEADVCQILFSSAIREIAAGGDYILIGIRDKVCPCGTLSLRDNHIVHPNAYANRTWGHTVNFSEDRFLMSQLADTFGFDIASIRVRDVPYPNRLAALIAKDVDFISAWWGTGYPDQILDAKADGISLDYVRWADFGLRTYGDCLLARRSWALSHRTLVESFLEIVSRTYFETLQDPETVLKEVLGEELLSKNVRDINKLRLGIKQSLELLKPSCNSATLLRVPRDEFRLVVHDILSRTSTPNEQIDWGNEFIFNDS
jgi:ABC-type nitrate/sulfonate/bicarbonate transport system substrate-binding protein